MRKTRKAACRASLVLLTAVALLVPLTGCSLGEVFSFVRNFNYGGSLLAIDPVTYAFMTSGYEGPGINPDVDPACTYPPYCNVYAPGSDPFSP